MRSFIIAAVLFASLAIAPQCQGGVCLRGSSVATYQAYAAPRLGGVLRVPVRAVEKSVVVTRRVLSAPRRVLSARPVRRVLGARPLRGLLCRRGRCG